MQPRAAEVCGDNWREENGEKEYLPLLQAALAGERKVPPPEGRIGEAWLACALYRLEGERALWEVLSSADELFYRVPPYDELSWAFLRLRKRGWLMVDGERFGLTPEGRRVIHDLKGRDDHLHWWEKIERWIYDHPLGDE